jgi:small subunit ribosomal protein S27Ae
MAEKFKGKGKSTEKSAIEKPAEKTATKPVEKKKKEKAVKVKKKQKGAYTRYKIDEKGFTRLRPFCERCGIGFFMADHGDRFSCGHCGFTRYKKA